MVAIKREFLNKIPKKPGIKKKNPQKKNPEVLTCLLVNFDQTKNFS